MDACIVVDSRGALKISKGGGERKEIPGICDAGKVSAGLSIDEETD